MGIIDMSHHWQKMKWFERLHLMRVIKKLSLRDVENLMDISNAYLSQIENGKVKDISIFKALELCKLYDISASMIFDDLSSNN